MGKFGVSDRFNLSPMGVGRLRAASYFSFESQYIKSTRERGSDGILPIICCTGRLRPKGVPFSGI